MYDMKCVFCYVSQYAIEVSNDYEFEFVLLLL